MTETKKLQGKVAVITGGTTGIGLATAKLFVSEGAYVFITGRRQRELDEAVAEIGSNVVGVQGDVSKPEDLDRLYQTVRAKGKLDVVFANAGVCGFCSSGKGHRGALRQNLQHQCEGNTVHGTKALAVAERRQLYYSHWLRCERERVLPAFGVYGASKAAIRSFVRTWTVGLKDRGYPVKRS